MEPPEALFRFATAELQAELQRRLKVEAERPRPPAGRCARCGAEWWFGGVFSAPNFERQAERFRLAHVNCPLSIDGAGI